MSHVKYDRVPDSDERPSHGNITAINNILLSLMNDLLPYCYEQYHLWLQFACDSPERKIIAIALLVALGFGVLMLIKRIHAV